MKHHAQGRRRRVENSSDGSRQPDRTAGRPAGRLQAGDRERMTTPMGTPGDTPPGPPAGSRAASRRIPARRFVANTRTGTTKRLLINHGTAGRRAEDIFEAMRSESRERLMPDRRGPGGRGTPQTLGDDRVVEALSARTTPAGAASSSSSIRPAIARSRGIFGETGERIISKALEDLGARNRGESGRVHLGNCKVEAFCR